MTVNEYRAALEGLSKEDFRRLCETWGGAKETVEATVQLFAHAEDKARWERIAIYHLGQVGIVGLETEEEKLLRAAKDSAAAANASAEASVSAARASSTSATLAKWALAVAVVSIVIAILLAVLT